MKISQFYLKFQTSILQEKLKSKELKKEKREIEIVNEVT